MAARLARQRQQRSKLRTSNVPLEEAAEGAAMTPGTVGSELQILRAEVAESGATITKLQTQLKQSDREMQEMGERTARMEAELRGLKAEAEKASVAAAPAAGAPAATDITDPIAELAKTSAPLAVSITLPSSLEGDDFSIDGVHVNIIPAAILAAAGK